MPQEVFIVVGKNGMLFHSHFLADTFHIAIYLINWLPTPLLNHQSPFEKLFNKHLDYTSLYVFGSASWPHLRPYNQHKLDLRPTQCLFLGYSEQHKRYKCLHIPTSWIYFSCDVVFDEALFPFSIDSAPTLAQNHTLLSLLGPLPMSHMAPQPISPMSSVNSTFSPFTPIISSTSM